MTPCVRSSTAWAAALVSRPNPLHGPADQSAITGDATVKSVPASAFEAAERLDARGTLDVWTLSGPSQDAVNSFQEKERVLPRESRLSVEGATFTHEFPAYSVTVLRLRGRE